MRRGCRLRGAVCSCGYPSGDRSMQRIQEAVHDGTVLFDEVSGVGVRGVVEDLLCSTAFHRLAVMHDDEAVCDERQSVWKRHGPGFHNRQNAMADC